MAKHFMHFHGAGGLAKAIADYRAECGKDLVVYRGHSRRKYPIRPSVLRKGKWIKNEDKMLRKLEASFPDEFLNDSSTMDKLARARHVNLPTRLLDVTTNPLVAIYFATKQSAGNHDAGGEVIAFRIKADKERFFDSDTISCIANLSYLRYKEKDQIASWLEANKGEISDEKKIFDAISAFNDEPYIKRLLQFIRVEKPYFVDRIDPRDFLTAWYVKPKMSTRRILAQSGAFLVFGNCPGKMREDPPDVFFPENKRSLFKEEESEKLIECKRFPIKEGESEKLLKNLEWLSIDERTLFPDIEKEARAIAESP